MANVGASVGLLLLAKLIDTFGRLLGLSLSTALLTLGCVIGASSHNAATYAASSIFYWAGYYGCSYVAFVIVADNWYLRGRAMVFGLLYSPDIATPYLGRTIAQKLEAFTVGWRWSLGSFAIAVPLSALPLVVFLLYKKPSAAPTRPFRSDKARTTLASRSKLHITIIDGIGMLLVITGLTLFFLPFSIHIYTYKDINASSEIIMLVIGAVLLVCFGAWERYFAQTPCVPFALMTNRTILGACLTFGEITLLRAMLDLRFWQWLQNVHNPSDTEAFHISIIGTAVFAASALVGGVYLRYRGPYKELALCVGAPLQALGLGIMIHFSSTSASLGLVILAQVIIAVGNGLVAVSAEVAVVSTCHRKHYATILAIYKIIGAIFQAIGMTIGDAIWDSVLRAVPVDDQEEYPSLAGYSSAMENLFITATALSILAFIGVALWKKVKV